MIPNLYPGTLIVVEGINGSGKTTQVRLLADSLRRERLVVKEFKEPNKDSEFGKRIYEELHKGPDGLAVKDPFGFQTWYACDSKDNLAKRIIPNLQFGAIIIQDRYRSSLVHGAKTRSDIESLMLMNRIIIGEHFIWPDVVFIINTPVEVAMERLKEKGGVLDAQENKAEQLRTAANFLVFAEMYPNCIVIEDSGTAASMEEKHLAIRTHVHKLLKKKP